MTQKYGIGNFKHRGVCQRYAKAHQISMATAQQHFEMLKRFLVAAAQSNTAYAPPSAQVDAIWHEFILFTADYRSFCQTYLGCFIDHQPTDEDIVVNEIEKSHNACIAQRAQDAESVKGVACIVQRADSIETVQGSACIAQRAGKAEFVKGVACIAQRADSVETVQGSACIAQRAGNAESVKGVACIAQRANKVEEQILTIS